MAPFCIFPARHRAHDFDPLVPSVPPPFSPRCPRSSSYIYVRHSSTSTCAASNARLASTAVHFGQRWSLPGVLRFIKHDLVKRKAAEKREQSKNPIWKDIPRGNNKTVRLLQRRYENGSSAKASSGRLARKVNRPLSLERIRAEILTQLGKHSNRSGNATLKSLKEKSKGIFIPSGPRLD